MADHYIPLSADNIDEALVWAHNNKGSLADTDVIVPTAASPSNQLADKAYVDAADATKQNLVAGASSGHIATLNGSGQVVDSGIAPSDKQDTLTFDDSPVNGSSNPVKSSGIYSSIANAVAGEASLREAADNTKQDLVGDAVAGNVASFDANGQVEDSGIAANDIALQDGNYPNMSVGVANNLTGRGDVPAEYTFRTSGGSADIGSGSALIKSMKGKSVVWNQLVGDASGTTNNVPFAITGGHLVASGTPNSSMLEFKSVSLIVGHKYLFIANSPIYGTGGLDANSVFTAATSGSSFRLLVTEGEAITIDSPLMLFDLTLMGIADEITTADDFKALYPLPYYNANAGAIVNNAATKIRTNGFNQWDEEWESGGYDIYGNPGPSNEYIRTKNHIPIIAGKTYYVRYNGTIPNGQFASYIFDSNDNMLLRVEGYNKTFDAPANSAYMVFNYKDTTYNNDICINLSWSGWRNGEYEAYWESELALNLPTITGVPSGSTTSETIFADGMRGVGDAYDELVVDSDGYARTAIKRMGIVDLGSLNWELHTNGFMASSSALSSAKYPTSSTITANIICSRLATQTSNAIYNLSQGIGLHLDGYIRIYYSGMSTDAATFKTAMSGVYLVYELATSVEYTLDTPIYMGYRVDDFGTEQRLPADTASAVTAPISYDVQYALNVQDSIRRLPENYLSKVSTTNLLEALKTAGVISAYTMVYNSATQEYAFTVTA